MQKLKKLSGSMHLRLNVKDVQDCIKSWSRWSPMKSTQPKDDDTDYDVDDDTTNCNTHGIISVFRFLPMFSGFRPSALLLSTSASRLIDASNYSSTQYYTQLVYLHNGHRYVIKGTFSQQQ